MPNKSSRVIWDKVVTSALKFTGGTPGVGKVLQSDASGNASWATPAPAYSAPYILTSTPSVAIDISSSGWVTITSWAVTCTGNPYRITSVKPIGQSGAGYSWSVLRFAVDGSDPVLGNSAPSQAYAAAATWPSQANVPGNNGWASTFAQWYQVFTPSAGAHTFQFQMYSSSGVYQMQGTGQFLIEELK